MGDGGDDILYGGPGTDTYDGGAGNDLIYVDAADVVATRPAGSIDGGSNAEDAEMPDSDTVSFELFTDEDGGVTGVILDAGLYDNIENAIGTDFADTITGSAVGNVIEGGAGGDTLSGGSDGIDTLSYENSDRRVRVNLDASSAVGGHATNDTITANTFENVIGSAYDDVLTGDEGVNVLTGGGGDDELVGGNETDADTGDTLKGGDGEDSLEGGAGDDTLEGGAGADELDGGDNEAGANTLSYAGSDAGVTVNLATASASGGHAEGDEIAVTDDVDHDGDEAVDSDGDNNTLEDSDTDRIDVATFRKVTGSDHNDTITGDYRMNVLMGGKGDDTLDGGANWDMLIGGPGADELIGGESGAVEDDEDTTDVNEARAEDVDWAVYRHAEGGVSVNLDTMKGTGGDAMGDVLDDIELVWGSEDAENGDTFIAGAGADLLHGDLGPDTLSYEASNMGVTVDLSDQITFDGDPTDTLITTSTTANGVGLPDEDLSPAIPYIVENDEGVLVEVLVGAATEEQVESNTNGAAGDRIGGIQNLTGSAFNDTLTGDAADNTLMGGDGRDTLAGGAGDDTLMGGDGDDTLSATSGENMLMGGAGDDTITGGSDVDTINGGAGDDDLNGGGGANTFVFSTADSGDSDAVLDWTAGTGNKIDLQAFDLTPEQVIGAITLRGTGTDAYVVINLTDFGGGRITIDDISDLDALDSDSGESDNTTAIETLDEGIFIL